MSTIRPLLILDTPAILATQERQWQEWVGFACCVLPQAVWQEMDFLTRRAVDPQQEAQARSFIRFHERERPFEVSAERVLLGPVHENTQDTSLSQRARQAQAVAECTYAILKQQPQALIVLLTHDTTLATRLYNLQLPHFAALSAPQLTQWIRQGQIPPKVQTAIDALGEQWIPAVSPTQVGTQSQDPAEPTVVLSRPAPNPTPVSQRPQVSPLQPLGTLFKTLVSGTMILAALTILLGTGLVAWRVMDPQGSEGVWQRFNLPQVR